MRVGIDVDGVLSVFDDRYLERLIELSGENLVGDDQQSIDWPPCWGWDRTYGYTPEVIDEVWAQIAADRGFWRWLPPYGSARGALSRLETARLGGTEIIFITNRPGLTAKAQTEEWLQAYGFPRPTVIISGDKGRVCAALAVDTYIDDKLGNVNDVAAVAPTTRCYLLDQPWNQEGVNGNDALTMDARVMRVGQIATWLDREGM